MEIARNAGTVRERFHFLPAHQETHRLNGGKLGKRLHHGVHHHGFRRRVGKVEHFLGQIDARHPIAHHVQIHGHVFRQHRAQAQPRGFHIVIRALHHQGKRRLGDAVRFRNRAHHGHEIAAVVLIIYDRIHRRPGCSRRFQRLRRQSGQRAGAFLWQRVFLWHGFFRRP